MPERSDARGRAAGPRRAAEPRLRIRPYNPALPGDRAAVLDICLRTGDAGRDATAAYPDPRELTERYAAPYLDLEPTLVFVVEWQRAPAPGGTPSGRGGRVAARAAEVSAWEDEERCAGATGAEVGTADVVGYVLGASDTAVFAERFVQRPSSLTRGARRAHAAAMLVPEIVEFPAHLHVDLLPEAQGQGAGRLLVETLLAELAGRGVPGVHLGVDPRNPGALAFYPRLGFTESRRHADGVVFVRALTR